MKIKSHLRIARAIDARECKLKAQLKGFKFEEPAFIEILNSSTSVNEALVGISNTLERLAELFLHHGNSTDGEMALLQALETRERALGSRHIKLVVLLNRLAALYLSNEAHAQALYALKRIDEILMSQQEWSLESQILLSESNTIVEKYYSKILESPLQEA